MKIIMVLTVIILLLTACSEKEPNQSTGENTTTSTMKMEKTVDKDISSDDYSASEEHETIEITADVLSFVENSISVSYEEKEYTLNLSECKFNSTLQGQEYPDITNRIINNPFGIKTKAIIKCDTAFTKAYYCDAITPNGSVKGPSPETARPKNERLIDSYSILGDGSYSVYDFTYYEVTEKDKYMSDGKIDLSGGNIFNVPKLEKGSSFSVMCFKFTEKNCFIGLYEPGLETEIEKTKNENGKTVSVSRSYSGTESNGYIYYGRVAEIDTENEKVKIELNGGASCSLTPSVTIGCHSFSVGDTVRARFTEQKDFLRSPEQESFDFAVIEKTGDIPSEQIRISSEKIYIPIIVLGDEKVMTIIPKEMIDHDTMEPVTETAGYTEIFVPFDSIQYICGNSLAPEYYVTTVRLRR